MPVYDVKDSSGRTVNVLVWFGNQELFGCQNALLLGGSGDVYLLKPEKVFTGAQIEHHRENYPEWIREIGSGGASDALRAGLSRRDRVCECWFKIHQAVDEHRKATSE